MKRFEEQLESSDGAALNSLPEALPFLSELASPQQLEHLTELVERLELEQALSLLRGLTRVAHSA